MKKKKVKKWKEGFWRHTKKGNRIWVRGRYIDTEIEFPSFTKHNTRLKKERVLDKK